MLQYPPQLSLVIQQINIHPLFKTFLMKTETNTTRYIVAGIGELLWDMLPGNALPGGAPANFAIHCQKLGAYSSVISAIGNDRDGKDIVAFLENKNINTALIKNSKRCTGHVFVTLDSNGKPDYSIEEDVAWDNIELQSQEIEFAATCDAVCFGSLAQRNKTSRESIQVFLNNTSEDCLRIFDINLRQNYYNIDTIEKSLSFANILKLNDEELPVLQKHLELPKDTEAAISEIIERYELSHLALTMGSQGSIMATPTETAFEPGLNIKISDTIGAGDSFTATMCMGILNNMPIKLINKLAGYIAAFVCTQPGATPTLPDELTQDFKQYVSNRPEELLH